MRRPKNLHLVTNPTEADEQIAFIAWLNRKGIKSSASANGGSRNLLEAIKLKRMGVSAGFPDVTIPIPSGGYHGLYIELKRKEGGRLSDNQIEWLTFLNEMGYHASRANGFDEAKDIVLTYLAMTKPAA